MGRVPLRQSTNMAAMIQPAKGKAKKIADKILGRKKDKGTSYKQKEPETTAKQSFDQLKEWRNN